jgi:hypothetical protein
LRRYFFVPNAATRHALASKARTLGLDDTWGSEDRGVLCVIAAAAAVTRWAEKVVGVHVRHGDKKTESAIIPIEHYLQAAKVSKHCVYMQPRSMFESERCAL